MTDHDRPTDELLRWLIRPDTFHKPIGWIVPMAKELIEAREHDAAIRAEATLAERERCERALHKTCETIGAKPGSSIWMAFSAAEAAIRKGGVNEQE